MEDSANLRSFSLSELLRSVRRCIEHTYPTRYWVRAEVSDLRRSGAGGHGYLELLEKGAGGDIVARVRATIWSTAYQQIERALAQQGLGSLSSGMNVLALVSLSYHELYGLSLNIADIDPRYSLGELARLRQETIARLKRQGLLEMNKELELPEPLQRLAIISSPTAAGYGDFMRQIEANSYGVKLYTALFRAQMQGEQTTDSVLSALERILRHQEHFDAVVIIRGGGAVSELRAFDDYRLCESCAQYPLPIITGIGHERDVSVLDLVAHSSFKTPTAVASYIIEGLATELGRVAYCSERLPRLLERLSLGRGQSLQLLSSRLQQTAQRSLARAQYSLTQQQSQLGLQTQATLRRADSQLGQLGRRLPDLLRLRLQEAHQELHRPLLRLPLLLEHLRSRSYQQLEHYEQAIRLSHPDNILRRGFSIVKRAGQIQTSASELQAGEELELCFYRDSVRVRVEG